MTVVSQVFLTVGACEARPGGPKITLHFLHLFVSLYICASPLITCAIITSCTLLPCNLARVDFDNLDGCFVQCSYYYEQSSTVTSSRQIPRSRGNARSEQLLVVPSAYRVANQQGMAARRALEWITASKPGWLLDMKYHTCLFVLGNGLVTK